MRWVLVLGLAVPAIAQDECGACAEVRKSLDGLCADDAAGRLQALTAIREAYPHAVLAIPTLFEVMEDDDARVRAAALATIEALGARGLAVYVSTFGSGSAWETAATTFADLYRRNNDLTFPEYFAVILEPISRAIVNLPDALEIRLAVGGARNRLRAQRCNQSKCRESEQCTKHQSPFGGSSAHSLNGRDAVQNRSRCALKFSCDYWRPALNDVRRAPARRAPSPRCRS
jgi:hypothetical protein